MPESAIRVEGLNHAFGKGSLRKQILFDITTEIPTGEVVIVTGPSGSGKTTFLTLVSALRSVQEGSVEVLGQQLRGARKGTLERVRKQIGFIFQQHNLLSALTAQQNVELGVRVNRRLGGSVKKRAREILGEVGLGDYTHHRPDQLSGGQRQRVAIARALGAEPSMLVADEPTASLDKQSGRDVADRMKSMARDHGATILLVTHDNRILDIADRIVYLEDGKLQVFTDAVIETSQKMMRVLAHTKRQEGDEEEADFYRMLEDFTEQAQRILGATGRMNDVAFRSMLEQGLQSFVQRFGPAMRAEHALMYLVRDGAVVSRAYSGALRPEPTIRLAVGCGLTGGVAQSGKASRRDDAGSSGEFSSEHEELPGSKTTSMLTCPMRDESGVVIGLVQVRNRTDRLFDTADERKLTQVASIVSPVVEALQDIADRST